MDDTFVYLTYLTHGGMANIGKSMFTNPEDREPGWYVRAYTDAGYKDVRKYTRTTPDHALAIAKAFDAPLPGEAITLAVDRQNFAHYRNRDVRRKEALAAIERAQATLAAIDEEEGT